MFIQIPYFKIKQQRYVRAFFSYYLYRPLSSMPKSNLQNQLLFDGFRFLFPSFLFFIWNAIRIQHVFLLTLSSFPLSFFLRFLSLFLFAFGKSSFENFHRHRLIDLLHLCCDRYLSLLVLHCAMSFFQVQLIHRQPIYCGNRSRLTCCPH